MARGDEDMAVCPDCGMWWWGEVGDCIDEPSEERETVEQMLSIAAYQRLRRLVRRYPRTATECAEYNTEFCGVPAALVRQFLEEQALLASLRATER